MNPKCNLFVYGTLRIGGPANPLLKGSRLVEKAIRLPGYKMFNAGRYPFAIPATPESSIVGDLYEVDEKILEKLDKFEGNEYVRKMDPALKCVIYLTKENTSELPEVKDGDWLIYARKHRIIFLPFDQ
jgi:gamma-glutamylcyclotransferase (GGCT)/AIG2-like uncharacterized protein YtfP